MLVNHKILQTSQTKLVKRRIRKATQKLSNCHREVRIASICDLETIVGECAAEHWVIMEILASFVRNQAGLKSWQDTVSVGKDIEAALQVIGRRDASKDLPQQQLDLSYTDIRGVNLSNANLQQINFQHTILYQANLYGANLTNANLSNATLSAVNLCNANLTNANLPHSILNAAKLCHASLTNANLHQANLFLANLHGANLQNANLEGANLRDVIF